MFRKILLAADGSTHSFRAAEKAIELAKYDKESFIEIIYVIDSHTSKADVLKYSNSIETEYKRKEKMAFIKKKAQKYDINYEIKILRGDPGPTIVKYSNDNNFDIVILGSRGLNLIQEMVLGSVSHKVAKRVHCPVMIVK